MSDDAQFSQRVRRLAITSAIVLALICLLATATLPVHPLVESSLVGGWLLMPSILGLSLRWPRLRYALILPSFLVSVALLAMCASARPEDRVARAGWVLVTTGVLLGGILGVWFWFRWIPVPSRLAHPFSRGRWALIAIHVLLIIVGLAVVSIAAIAWTG